MNPTALLRWSRSTQGKATLASCAGVLVVTALLLFGSAPGSKKGDYRFMHCPKCGAETVYNPSYAGEPCIRCKQARMVPTTASMSSGESASLSTSGRIGVFLFVLVILLQLVIYLSVSHARTAHDEEKEALVKSHCPRCSRKLGYPVSKAGTMVRCPGCKKQIVLPTAAA